MPSTNQAGDRGDRMRCPKLVEDIGEDPARWLDQDLKSRSTLRQQADTSSSRYDYLAVPDTDTTTNAEFVLSLIDGIDTVERIRAWRAVEYRLANDDQNGDARNPLEEPRSAIIQRLDQREQWLELHGERPDRLPFGPRESCDCCEADGFVTAAELRERRDEEWSRRSDGYSANGADTSETSPETEEVGLGAFATDGGTDQ